MKKKNKQNEYGKTTRNTSWPYLLYIFFLSLQIISWIYQRGVLVADIGEDTYFQMSTILHTAVVISMAVYFYYKLAQFRNKRDRLFFSILWLWGLLVVIARWWVGHDTATHTENQLFWTTSLLYLHLLTLGFIEFSRLNQYLSSFKFGPGRILILSFVLLILIGTFLLLLPASTTGGIHIIDALFTSTSAVCVTGLIVVDTASTFTPFGKTIIMILFQLGGIGMMTFTSFFGFFFKGNFSYSSQIYIKDFVNSDQLADLFKVIFKILFFTLIIEGIGAVIIFLSLEENFLNSVGERWFFSVFHSISAFCNAGFSTLEYGLYELPVRFNYTMQLVIVGLIIVGGIGFTVMLHLYDAFKIYIKKFRGFRKTFDINIKHENRLNLNTMIVVRTTAVLILTGSILMFILEYNHTLAEHKGIGKYINALFEAVTPRTAGFNSVDLNQMSFAAVMLTMLLMWIGASPGSTGGGIKTTTFALAFLNIISLARGKDRVEFHGRHIPAQSIRRAFAVISLSLIFIGFSIFVLSFTDSRLGFLELSFEVFSAFSTVGLSLGITGSLSDSGKLVMVIIMFVGRVGAITLLISIFRKVKSLRYQYPQEDILIS